jgi:antitoxin HicB
MQYHFKVHREDGGFWAECVELPGCSTQGDTMGELMTNMEEALSLFLNEGPEFSGIIPLPRKKLRGGNIVKVAVEPRVALAILLRHIRRQRGITQKQAAHLIGLKGLYSYQRLESPKTANPELETLAKIKKAFPEVDLDELVAA